MIKQCTRCLKNKHESQFYRDAKVCKPCLKVQARAHRLEKRFGKRMPYKAREEIFLAAQKRSYKSGMEFNITLEDVILPDDCPLLGVKFDYSPGYHPHSPSLDRINNSEGYIKGNVWMVSRKANTMKSNASKEELLTFAKNILKHFGDKDEQEDKEDVGRCTPVRRV